jgi:hypothetical protein
LMPKMVKTATDVFSSVRVLAAVKPAKRTWLL